MLIDNFLLVDAGPLPARPRCARCSRSGDWPARNPDRNIADLKAQVAACARGAGELRRVAGEYGRDVVDAYMGHVMANAEEAVRRLIGRLEDGSFRYEMDNGAEVCGHRHASIATARSAIGRFHRHQRPAARQFQRALFDLPGGDALCVPHPGRRRDPDERRLHAADHADGARRLDAQPALSGRGRRRQCRDQPGRSPTACSPPVGALAPSQGTMNNFTFGNARHQYYETIAGGAGRRARLRRSERGADPHDQQPPHRSRNAGDAAFRCCSSGSRSAAARAARARTAAATASSGTSASCEPMHGQHPLQPPPGARRAGIAGGGDAEPGRQPGRPRRRQRGDCSAATASAEMAAGRHVRRSRRRAEGAIGEAMQVRQRSMNYLAAARHPDRRPRLRAAAQSDARGARSPRSRPGCSPGSIRSRSSRTLGKAFNDNRHHRHPLDRAAGDRPARALRPAAARARADHPASQAATVGRLLILYLLYRQIISAIGLHSTAGHPQTVRPLVAPMARGRGREQQGELDEATARARSRPMPPRPTMSACSSARTSSSRSARSC